MNVVKCENSHFFDSDTYTECPVCGGKPATAEQQAAAAGKEKKKGGLFSKFKKEPAAPKQPAAPSFPAQTTSAPAPAAEQPAAVPQTANSAPVMNACEDSVTVPMPAVAASACEDSVTVPMPAVVADACEDAVTVPMPVIAEGQAQEPAQVDQPASEPSSLSDAIKQASANSEGKTASYFSAVTSGNSAAESSSSSAPAVQKVNTEPVVGWLVCIEGSHIGNSFCIAAGKNSLGRGSSNSIILNRDNSVSREKHAILVYEPKKRNFYIQPGDSSGLTYLNDEYITESKKLADRDIIEIGNTKLLFVPLCDEKFSWEDYFNKEK